MNNHIRRCFALLGAADLDLPVTEGVRECKPQVNVEVSSEPSVKTVRRENNGG